MTDSEMPARISDSALERRARRWLAGGPFPCFIQTAPGQEDDLEAEIRRLGLATEMTAERGGVRLQLDHMGIMRANLELRTASRVLLQLDNFAAPNREALYDHSRRIPWEVQLGTAPRYRLRSTSRNSALQAGDDVLNTVETAISRSMREHGLYPRRDDEAELEFLIRLNDNRATISFNTSGEHLHRRGSRTHIGDAPLRETIAAALVLAALDGHDVIVDPFCGAGTLLTEAGEVLRGLPPGRERDFGFEAAGWFRPGGWREVRRQSTVSISGGATRLFGSDTDAAALAAAAHNLEEASVKGVTLALGDATEMDLDSYGAIRGLLLSNVPWGVRLGDPAQAAELLRAWLDRVAAASRPWDLAILTQHPEILEQDDRFEVRSRITVDNGGLKVSRVLASRASDGGNGAAEDGD